MIVGAARCRKCRQVKDYRSRSRYEKNDMWLALLGSGLKEAVMFKRKEGYDQQTSQNVNNWGDDGREVLVLYLVSAISRARGLPEQSSSPAETGGWITGRARGKGR